MIKVYNAKDVFETTALIAELESKGIPCYSKEAGAGEFMKITSNYSGAFGIDIFVLEENEIEARAVIKDRLSSMEKTKEQPKELVKLRWIRQIFAIGMTVGIVCVILFSVLTNL